jgi:Carboxypeptidase regulatory-like domain
MVFEWNRRAEGTKSGPLLRIDISKQYEDPTSVSRQTVRSSRNVLFITSRLFVICWLLSALTAYAQKATGGIQGALTDTSGAAVPGATITLTDEARGQAILQQSDGAGVFRFPELKPASYALTIAAHGFKETKIQHVVVLVSQVTPLKVSLEIGDTREEVTVTAGSTHQVETVSTESGTVITSEQIQHLAIVGRNVMDLAQLAPGVQLRDGSDIDPTKNNFTIASFQGRSGRETQVQWDGLSIQDHTVGGAVQNVGLDAIGEFQVAQTTLNPAQSVASGGAVNMVSRAGGNQIHGSAFDFFRDSRMGAKLGAVRFPYDRNQFGGRLGGAFIPNKFFYFADIEATNARDSFYGNTPFPSLTGFYPKLYLEKFAMGRLDYTLNNRWQAFARYSYANNQGVVGNPTLGNSFIDGMNQKTDSNAVAVSISRIGERSTNTFAYGFTTYSQELIPDPAVPSPVDSQGRQYLLQIDGGSTLSYGPNWLADQYQKVHTYQGKYDGSKQIGQHTLSYGVDMTHWVFAGLFDLRGNGPELDSYTHSLTGPVTSPEDYPLVSISLGNRLGYYSTSPALGFPKGGVFQWRPALYFHDSWRLSPRLTLNGGVRWTYLRGQFNEDLDRGTLIDEFHPGYGGHRHTPKTSFGPQLGFAYDPTGSGKTAIRSAAGLYFEELTFDGFVNDSTAFIPAGIAQSLPTVSSGTGLIDPRTGVDFVAGDPLASSYGFPNGTSGAALAGMFGVPISSVATQALNLSALFVAASALNTSTATSLDLTHSITANAFTAGVKNPRVFQFNASLQHELAKEVIFTGEFVLVHGYEFPLSVDENHVGSAIAANFDATAAASAIAQGNASVGCGATLAGTDCAIATGATIATYSGYGLGAGYAAQGYAFSGQNKKFGQMLFAEHKAYNNYKGVNLRIDAHWGQPSRDAFSWLKSNNLTFGYTIGSNTGNLRTGGTGTADPAAFASAWDNTNPLKFDGPDVVDRKNMLTLATITEFKKGFTFSQITHWYSALPQNILIPTAFSGCQGGPEEIFCSDVTGDGTTNDLLPTAGAGAFGRSVKASRLNSVIDKYNTSYAGKPTPAGNLLVLQGLLNANQLQRLGGVMPVLPDAPKGETGLDLLLLTDVRLAYSHSLFSDRISIEPSFDAFNVFNRTSYDPPGNLLNGNLYGTPGSINGTLPSQRTNVRQRGSGTFEQGARRQMQAGLRISF